MHLALTTCSEPGCPELVTAGRCARHRRAHDQQRGSSTSRGYTWAWRRLRSHFLRARCQSCGGRPTATCTQCGGIGLANRFCAECLADGRLVLGTEVDHVLPHQQWPTLRLDTRDLQSLCQPHHARKTNAETSGRQLSVFQQSQRSRVLVLLAENATGAADTDAVDTDAVDTDANLPEGLPEVYVTARDSPRTDHLSPTNTRQSVASPQSNSVGGVDKLPSKSHKWRTYIGMDRPVIIPGEMSYCNRVAPTCENPRNSKTDFTIGAEGNSLNLGTLPPEPGSPDPPESTEKGPIVRSPR